MGTGTVSTFAASSSAQIFTGHRSTPHFVWAATALGARRIEPEMPKKELVLVHKGLPKALSAGV
jgi:hypothetical protein